jgi:pimeloyl-ACP methyl ester carboxylesterase
MRRLRVGDRVVRVRDEGESEKPALVCIHGAGSSSVLWMDVVRRLQPRRRVVAPDLPGHGQSDRWHTMDQVSIEMYRDAVGTVCAELHIERAVLMGHSMGGLVALAAAAAWPERVAGVVLVNSGAWFEVAPALFDKLASDFARFGKWLARYAWSPTTPLDTIERWGTVVLTADQEVTTADFRAVERYDARPLLATIRAPTLALGGADDRLAPPERTRELAEGIRGAEAVIVPRAAHMLMQEQPDVFFTALDRFLVTT